MTEEGSSMYVRKDRITAGLASISRLSKTSGEA